MMEIYKQFALQMASDAGDIIKKNFLFGMEKELKSDNTPVTKTDKEINTLLLTRVKQNFPEHNIFAEEESDMNRESEFVWVCDPIDGTIPFSHGVPCCTFSLALVKNGESILGVVYEPFQDRMFVAQKGKGAFLNGEKIFVSKATNFVGAVANCEFYNTAPFDTSKLAAYLQMEKGIQTLRMGSYIYSGTLVAAGEFAFAVFPGHYAHDAAAVKILVEEAGGKVTNIFGEEQRYDQDIQGLIASNGILHDEIVKICRETVVKLVNV